VVRAAAESLNSQTLDNVAGAGQAAACRVLSRDGTPTESVCWHKLNDTEAALDQLRLE
jgi:hypothetical protein